MRSVRFCAVAMLVLLQASSSSAALSKDVADFAKGPAELLMTKEDKKEWKAITTDDQAKAFIDLFWARRDPTPGTPKNEFLLDFQERVVVANERFDSVNGPGAKSDRGKVFILMGSPTKIRRTAGPPATIQTGGRGFRPSTTSEMAGGVQGSSGKELWEYEQVKTAVVLGQPLVRIAFVDQYGTGEYNMERTAQTDVTALFESVARSFVKQPDLTSVPVAAPSIPLAQPPAPLTSLTNDAYRSALAEARGATQSSGSLFVTYGEFITPEGEHFVPVHLYVPKTTGLMANASATFFGTVEKEGGEVVAVFEEPATLTASKDGVFFARSLELPPGKYRGSFGLAKDGAPVAASSVALVVSGLDKAAPGVSALILTDNIYPLTEPQSPKDPFAFGGLKVVPKSDTTFRKTEELSYFFEVRNPGIDPATSQPKMTMKRSVTGTSADGKTVKMAGAAEMMPLQESKGVPGHYVFGQAIPLSSFRPGSYTLSLKLTDLTLGQSYELSGTFRVIE
jgi:GWxTD domain-containing protein